MGDSTLMPEHFTGRDTTHAAEWLDRFLHFGNFKKWTDAQKVEVFPLFLKDSAYLWYKDFIPSLGEDIIIFDEVERLFRDKYVHPTDRWALLESFVSRRLSPTEPIDTYLADLTQTASLLGKTDMDLMDAFVRGLDDGTKQHVLMKQPTALNEAVSFARLARSIIPQIAENTGVKLAIDTLRDQIATLAAKLAPSSSQVNTFQSRQNQYSQPPRQSSRYTTRPWQPPQQQFQPLSYPDGPHQQRRQPPPQRQQYNTGRTMARARPCYRCGDDGRTPFLRAESQALPPLSSGPRQIINLAPGYTLAVEDVRCPITSAAKHRPQTNEVYPYLSAPSTSTSTGAHDDHIHTVTLSAYNIFRERPVNTQAVSRKVDLSLCHSSRGPDCVHRPCAFKDSRTLDSVPPVDFSKRERSQ
ncbi:uncharacterized protein [Haliotis cracherodii]|uniref:uncharacterized protein n=1 Tax=Haliotis cracherodii TaxID=6455 RepID=UPI0039EB6C22